MARNLSTQDISWFLDLFEKEQLDLNPPYQRRSVWSPKDKRFFIDTVLNNYPAPPIFLHKTLNEQGKATYHVVDGKQRLQTIIEFTQNNVRIPDDFSNANLQKKRFSDLERSHREQFWNYVLIVEMLPDVSESSVKNIFERINRNSRKLMPQELRHAKYDGWFVTCAESESEKQEWRDFRIVTSSRSKRMADVQFISELMTIVIKNKLNGFDQDDLDDIYAEYDDLIEQAMFVEEDFKFQFEAIKEYIRTVLSIDSSLVSALKIQSHFYSLWGYLSLEKHRLKSPADFVTIYRQFLSDVSECVKSEHAFIKELEDSGNGYVEAVINYSNNTRGASTDITPRMNRHKALITVVHEIEN
jgi:hypothetical protein